MEEYIEDPSTQLIGRITELLISQDNIPYELQTALDEIITLAGQIAIIPLYGTKLICNVCHTVNAAGYKLKRSAGKYIALCVDEFGGCAGKEVHHKCNYVDHIGIECEQLAEYQITYGQDKLLTRYACIVHAGVLMKDTEQTVHPIR
jgi:hypothetical protein